MEGSIKWRERISNDIRSLNSEGRDVRERLIVNESQRGIEERISLIGRSSNDSNCNDIGSLLKERSRLTRINESRRKSDGTIEELGIRLSSETIGSERK